MGDAVFRKRRRVHLCRKTKKKLRLVILCAALFLLFVLARGFSPKIAVVFNPPGISLPESFEDSSIFREVLKVTLPGFSAVAAGEPATSMEMLNTTLLALVDINPLDPKTFLSTQISGMRSFAGTYRRPDDQDLVDPPPDSYPALLPSGGEPHLGGDLNGGILIYHAHTTESFEPSSGQRFTTDLSQTVAFLGHELKTILERDYGVLVVHDDTIHDTLRSTAYQKARPTAQKRIQDNPDLKVVVDLHRDGVARRVTTADIKGHDVGKILLVVGSGHKEWQQNLAVATAIHNNLERIAPGLSRGLKERNLTYNQDLHPGALLVEVGGHENTLEEVRRTLPYLAQALAELIYQLP